MAGFLAEADPTTPPAPGSPTPQVGGLAGPLERGGPGAQSPTFKRPAKWEETQGGAAGQERVQEDLCLLGPHGMGEGVLLSELREARGSARGLRGSEQVWGPAEYACLCVTVVRDWEK